MFLAFQRNENHQKRSPDVKVMLKTVRKLKSAVRSGGSWTRSGFSPETPVWSQRLRSGEPLSPETPVLGRRLRSGGSCSSRTRPGLDFGRKNSTKSTKLMGETKELGYGNAKEGRSTSFASNPRIKTYQNALKSQIGPKYELRLFFVGFSNLGKKKICGGGWDGRGLQIREKPLL